MFKMFLKYFMPECKEELNEELRNADWGKILQFQLAEWNTIFWC